MSDPILVTGGTGTLGIRVLERLGAAGRSARVLSRRPRENRPGVDYVIGDAISGEGLDAAFRGGGTLLHLAGDAKHDERTTQQVADASRRAGVGHLVLISVTAADRIPLGYYRSKAASERIVAESGVPFSILRAAQFHEFVMSTVGWLAKLPVTPSPDGMRVEPIDAGEVATRLVELAVGEPQGRVADLAGPDVLDLPAILRPLRRGRRVRVIPVRIPGAAGRVYRSGANLAGPDADRGTRSFAEWVAARG